MAAIGKRYVLTLLSVLSDATGCVYVTTFDLSQGYSIGTERFSSRPLIHIQRSYSKIS